MKVVLAILCSLVLVLGPAMAMAGPAAGVGAPKHDCGCGGRMSCCQHATLPQPSPATAPAGSQTQIISVLSASLIRVLAHTGLTQISPTVSPASAAVSAPIFVRHCAWLI